MPPRRLGERASAICANGLIGSCVGYYAAVYGITFEEGEEIERSWRRGFAADFGRPLHSCRAELYMPRGLVGGGVGRDHAWVRGVADQFCAIAACLGDAADTDDRAVVRSQLALNLNVWGASARLRTFVGHTWRGF